MPRTSNPNPIYQRGLFALYRKTWKSAPAACLVSGAPKISCFPVFVQVFLREEMAFLITADHTDALRRRGLFNNESFFFSPLSWNAGTNDDCISFGSTLTEGYAYLKPGLLCCIRERFLSSLTLGREWSCSLFPPVKRLFQLCSLTQKTCITSTVFCPDLKSKINK